MSEGVGGESQNGGSLAANVGDYRGNRVGTLPIDRWEVVFILSWQGVV
jgi:hypothetical protein